MKCTYCNSEWQTTYEVKTCPFCGKSLTMEPPVFLDIEQALRFILDTYGGKVENNPNRIIAYLGDLAPDLVNERRLLKMCADTGILADLLSITDEAEKKLAARRAVAKLSSMYFLDAKWAETAVGWITGSPASVAGESVTVPRTQPVEKPNEPEKGAGNQPAPPLIQAIHIGGNVTATRALKEPQIKPSKPTAPSPWTQRERIRKRREELKRYAGRIVCSSDHVLGLRWDGTVIAAGNAGHEQCNRWRDITAIACAEKISIGLTANREILVVSSSPTYFNPWLDPRRWQDIVQAAAGSGRLVGLRADGRVMCSEQILFNGICVSPCCKDSRRQVCSNWRNVTAVACGTGTNYGLRTDGTVIACGSNEKGQCNVGSWSDIASIAAEAWTIYGLRRDGRVCVQGFGANANRDVENWRDIIDIKPGSVNGIIGLRADGSVACAGGFLPLTLTERRQISAWTDIVAIDRMGRLIAGLKADGTVVTVGGEKCDTSSFRDIAAIACGCGGVVGLQADGTVVYAGINGRGGGSAIAGQNLFC